MRVLCDGIFTLSVAAIPALQKKLFDYVTSNEINVNSFLSIAITYVACLIVGVIFSYLSMIFTWKSSLKFEQTLKKDFFKSVFCYKYENFSKRELGEYISIQANDITALEQDYLTPLIDIIQASNKILIFGIFLFFNVDWRISLVIILGSILTILIPKFASKPLAYRRNSYLNQMGIYVSKITDFLTGFKVIQSRTRNNINAEHEKSLNKTIRMRYKYGKFKCLTMALEHLSLNLVSAISFIFASILLIKSEITLGTCVATFGYVNSFISPINDFMYDFNAISSLKDIKEKIISYLEECSQDNLKIKVNFNDKIVLKNICFNYNNFLLNNINFEFEKGKKYALIGHNGSGKSTLINILMSYLTPDYGTIQIDGDNVQSIDLSYIMYCLNQNEHIFTTDFINNSTVFSSYSHQEVNDIVSKLNIDLFDGIRSNNNSSKLSGGEKQILGIIRMLASKTDIYLMDEPFAAIDEKNTALLEKFIFNMPGKTIIMVTHDLSENLKKFDNIIVMSSGRIIQVGTFEEISKSDEFKILCKNLKVSN